MEATQSRFSRSVTRFNLDHTQTIPYTEYYGELPKPSSDLFDKYLKPYMQKLYKSDTQLRDFDSIVQVDLEDFKKRFNVLKASIEDELKNFVDLDVFNFEWALQLDSREADISLSEHIKSIEFNELYSEDKEKFLQKMSQTVSNFKLYYCYLASQTNDVYLRSDIVNASSWLQQSSVYIDAYIKGFKDFNRIKAQPYSYSNGLLRHEL